MKKLNTYLKESLLDDDLHDTMDRAVMVNEIVNKIIDENPWVKDDISVNNKLEIVLDNVIIINFIFQHIFLRGLN